MAQKNQKLIKKPSVRLWLLYAAIPLALSACAGSAREESTGEIVDDSVITTKVKSAFVADKKVSAMNVSVETFKGVVQLSGFASDAEESSKAAELARNVKGVKGVRNNIAIK